MKPNTGKPQIETECRRCDGCVGAEHHWLECVVLYFDYGCKHCSAVGDMCDACDGSGIDPGFTAGEKNCEECGGAGVILVGWFEPKDEDE